MAWTWNVDDKAPDNGPNLTAMAIVFSAAALLSILLRAYVRFYLLKAVGADDWAIIVSWITACGYTACTIAREAPLPSTRAYLHVLATDFEPSQETKWGLGLRNQAGVPAQNEYNIILIQFISAPFYIISVLCFRLSLLLSYLRIIPGRGWRATIIAVMAACVLFHTTYLVLQMSRCLPPDTAWSPSIATGFCVAPVPFFISMASITIVFDLTVMFLPFPTLWRSRIQKRRKAVFLGLFATGLFITVIQIVRIQTIKNPDDFLNPSKLVMWSYIEANLAVVVVCVPTLSPLATYFVENLKTSRAATTSGGGTVSRGTRTTAAAAAGNPSSSSLSAYALQPWRSGGATATEGRKEGRIFVSREVSVTTGGEAGGSRNESQESMIHHDHHSASQGRIMKKTELHLVRDPADAI